LHVHRTVYELERRSSSPTAPSRWGSLLEAHAAGAPGTEGSVALRNVAARALRRREAGRLGEGALTPSSQRPPRSLVPPAAADLEGAPRAAAATVAAWQSKTKILSVPPADLKVEGAPHAAAALATATGRTLAVGRVGFRRHKASSPQRVAAAAAASQSKTKILDATKVRRIAAVQALQSDRRRAATAPCWGY